MRISLILPVLLVVDSLHFVFARALEPYLAPEVGAFFVLATGTVEVGIYALARGGGIQWHLFRQHIPFFLSIGFLVGTSTALNYAAVGYIDPGTASMLAQTATVFALGLGLFWLREQLNRLEWIGAIMCVFGAFIVSYQGSGVIRVGALLVLCSAFMYALHAAIVKRYGGNLDFVQFFFFRLLSTSTFLLIFSLSRGNLQMPAGPAWLILIVAGTVDVVISRALYYVALRRLRLGIHATFLTLSPVLTVFWSWLLFRALPTAASWIGGLTVISGIILVSLGRQRQRLRQR